MPRVQAKSARHRREFVEISAHAPPSRPGLFADQFARAAREQYVRRAFGEREQTFVPHGIAVNRAHQFAIGREGHFCEAGVEASSSSPALRAATINAPSVGSPCTVQDSRQRQFFDLSDRDKRDILKLMARVAEQAYRLAYSKVPRWPASRPFVAPEETHRRNPPFTSQNHPVLRDAVIGLSPSDPARSERLDR